ncbi:hypothetical protein [Kitasatospora sp. NPDC004289]
MISRIITPVAALAAVVALASPAFGSEVHAGDVEVAITKVTPAKNPGVLFVRGWLKCPKGKPIRGYVVEFTGRARYSDRDGKKISVDMVCTGKKKEFPKTQAAVVIPDDEAARKITWEVGKPAYITVRLRGAEGNKILPAITFQEKKTIT